MSNIWNEDDLDMEEVVEEALDASEDYSNSYLKNEAVKRISKAKLFESLLTASFFDEEEVESSIKREVEKEIKTFIVSRLEELLGIKSPSEQNYKVQQNSSKSQLSLTAEETAALKLVAKKITSTIAPQQQVQQPIKKITKKRTVVKSDNQEQARPQAQQRSRTKSRSEIELNKSSNVSKSTGQNYAQVNNPERIPQPSQEVMNQIMQTQAAKSFANFSGGQSQESQILAAAISLAQQKNKNVRED